MEINWIQLHVITDFVILTKRIFPVAAMYLQTFLIQVE